MRKTIKTKRCLCFRQWTRKRYAVFNSIGKQVKIGVLAVGYSLLGLQAQAIAAQAQAAVAPQAEGIEADSGGTAPVQLAEVLVQTTKPAVYSELARVVSTIQRKDIALLPVDNIEQVLNQLSSLDIRQRGSHGIQADISIRGGSYDQVLVMLNGVSITDPQTGHHNLNIPVDLASIDRIEVLQGAGSRVLGPQAFAGAINIVTGTATTSKVQAEITAGQHAFAGLRAGGVYVQQGLKVFASAQHQQSVGYMPNSDFENLNAFAQLRYHSKRWGEVNTQFGYQHKEFGANGFYSLAYPNQYEAMRTFASAATHTKQWGALSLHSQLSHRRKYDRFELFRDSAPAWYTGHNYHQTDVLGGGTHARYRWLGGTTSAGANLRLEHIYSNNIGDSAALRPVPWEPAGLYDNKEKGRWVLDWFAEHSYLHERFSASVGLTGCYSADFGHFAGLGADVGLQATPRLRLFASYNQSLRLPTFTDLYYQSKTHQGNRQLHPEQADNTELGARYTRSVYSVEGALFYRRGHNIIDWVRTTDQALWQALNHISLNTYGAECEARYTPRARPGQYRPQLRLSYTYLHMSKENHGMESSRILDHLQHKVALGIVQPLPVGLGLSGTLVHERRAGTFVDMVSKAEQHFPQVTLVDARLYWQRKWLTVYAEASNLFNTHYFDYANLPQPGRWIKGGVQVAW